MDSLCSFYLFPISSLLTRQQQIKKNRDSTCLAYSSLLTSQQQIKKNRHSTCLAYIPSLALEGPRKRKMEGKEDTMPSDRIQWLQAHRHYWQYREGEYAAHAHGVLEVNMDRHCIRSLALDMRFHSTRRSRNSITCERVQNVSDDDGNGRAGEHKHLARGPVGREEKATRDS
jgi:hypothetical protein